MLAKNKLKIIETLYNCGVLKATKPLIAFGGRRTKPIAVSHVSTAFDVICYSLSFDSAGPQGVRIPPAEGVNTKKMKKTMTTLLGCLQFSQGLYYEVEYIKRIQSGQERPDEEVLAIIREGLALVDISSPDGLNALALSDIEKRNIIARLRYTEHPRMQPGYLRVDKIFERPWKMLGLEGEPRNLNNAIKRVSQAMVGEGTLDSTLGL